MSRKPLINLRSREYEHPFDKSALDRLENTRGLEMVTQKVLDLGLERMLRIKHAGDNIRLTKENSPDLHAILEEACSLLSLKRIPELYINLDDKINSLTSGESRTQIVISSGCVELLNEEEMLFMLGREVGHIKSGHVFYQMMADSLQAINLFLSEATLGISNLVSMPLKAALLHWYRMAEFTADRAGLLACQDMEVAANTFIKMAGLPKEYHGRVSVQDLRNQAKEFDDIKEKNNLDKVIRFAASYENRQPFTIIRASQLFQWNDSGEFGQVLNKEDRLESPIGFDCLNRNCPFPFAADELYCRECGIEVRKGERESGAESESGSLEINLDE